MHGAAASLSKKLPSGAEGIFFDEHEWKYFIGSFISLITFAYVQNDVVKKGDLKNNGMCLFPTQF